MEKFVKIEFTKTDKGEEITMTSVGVTPIELLGVLRFQEKNVWLEMTRQNFKPKKEDGPKS